MAAAALALLLVLAAPVAEEVEGAGCCWSFNAQTKRYQFYIKPPTAAQCVLPYKPAACPSKPPPPSASAAASAASPPPPPPTGHAVAAGEKGAAVVARPPPAGSPPPPPPPPPPAVAAATAALASKPAFRLGSKAAAKADAKVATAVASQTASSGSADAASVGGGGGKPGPAAGGSKATAAGGKPPSGDGTPASSGGSSFLGVLFQFGFVLALVGGAWFYRGPLCARLAEFFPSDGGEGSKARSLAGGAKPPKDKYKRVDSSRSDRDETLSQTSCGLTEEEIDPAAEEWAARLAAQREGREYVPSTPACTTVTVGVGVAGGAGAVPSFGCTCGAAAVPAPASAAEDDFGGFDGFGDDEKGNSQWGGAGGDRGWGGGEREPSTRGMGGVPSSVAGAAGGPPSTSVPADGWATGGVDLDVGALENSSEPRPSYPVSHTQMMNPKPVDDIDWGILGEDPPAEAPDAAFSFSPMDDEPPLGGRDEEEDEFDLDDEFTVFDGFGRDNKPVRSDGAKSAASGAGLSWDEERQVWEKANRSMFGRPVAKISEAFSGVSSPWDLRAATPSFRSPETLNRFRSQAEDLFNQNVSSSLFTSPTMQRFRAQTDELLSDVGKTLSTVTSSITQTFWSLFR